MTQSLKQYNTFNVESSTSNLIIINNDDDVVNLLNDPQFSLDNFFFIGAGSNLLLLENVPEYVIAMRMEGINYQKKSNDEVIVTVAAGVNWHHLVEDSLSKGFFGLENLALIPGLVGAAPIQNIGAYGVELADRFISLTTIDLESGKKRIFNKEECQFGYRDSFFKHPKGKSLLVTSVQLLLSSVADVCIDYRALQTTFIDCAVVTPKMVFDKVCQIRKSKLPDPKVLGNAGSFFKNPVVSSEQYTKLKIQFPEIIAYPQQGNRWKLAAGWMIEKAGLKGYQQQGVGVHIEQALVLVNYTSSSGIKLAKLAQYVHEEIELLFSVKLEAEVTILGSSGAINLRDVI